MLEVNTVYTRSEYSINAKRPSSEGGRTKGFTGIQELFYQQILLMRQIFSAISALSAVKKTFCQEIVATLSQQLSWSHFVEIVKIEDTLKRGLWSGQFLQCENSTKFQISRHLFHDYQFGSDSFPTWEFFFLPEKIFVSTGDNFFSTGEKYFSTVDNFFSRGDNSLISGSD